MFRLLEDPTQKPTEVLYNLSLKGASASSASLAVMEILLLQRELRIQEKYFFNIYFDQ
jgi:hypothetical protein